VRNYRLLLEEQRAQLSATIDQITERNRKMGATVHKSVYQLIHQQSAQDKDAAYIQPLDILDDLREDKLGFSADRRVVMRGRDNELHNLSSNAHNCAVGTLRHSRISHQNAFRR
jgi:starvation-inducible DNA-binding protein